SVIRRLVGIAGVGYDLSESYATPLITPFLAPVFGSDSTRWALAAPTRHVTSAAPPALLIHGLNHTAPPPPSTHVFAKTSQQAAADARGHPGRGALPGGETLRRGVCRGVADRGLSRGDHAGSRRQQLKLPGADRRQRHAPRRAPTSAIKNHFLAHR